MESNRLSYLPHRSPPLLSHCLPSHTCSKISIQRVSSTADTSPDINPMGVTHTTAKQIPPQHILGSRALGEHRLGALRTVAAQAAPHHHQNLWRVWLDVLAVPYWERSLFLLQCMSSQGWGICLQDTTFSVCWWEIWVKSGSAFYSRGESVSQPGDAATPSFSQFRLGVHCGQKHFLLRIRAPRTPQLPRENHPG